MASSHKSIGKIKYGHTHQFLEHGPVHSCISQIFIAETRHLREQLKGVSSKASEALVHPSVREYGRADRNTEKARGKKQHQRRNLQWPTYSTGPPSLPSPLLSNATMVL